MKPFLTLLAILVIISGLNAENKNSVDTALVHKIIKENFIKENNAVVRYINTNILIQLEGYPNRSDSLIFLSEIEKIKPLISDFYIDLVNSKAPNLIFAINQGPGVNIGHFFSVKDSYNAIYKLKAHLFLYTKDSIEKRKIIKYFLYRALVNFDEDDTLQTKISGSIFSETDIGKTKSLAIDSEIIKDIYSGKYDSKTVHSELQKTKLSQELPKWLLNLKRLRYFPNILRIVSLVLPVLLLMLFYYKGYFRPHGYNFFPFVKQGILILFAILICFLGTFLGLFLKTSPWSLNNSYETFIINLLWAFLLIILIGLISIPLIWFTEKKLITKYSNPLYKTVLPSFATALVPTLLWTTLYVAFAKKTMLFDANAFYYLSESAWFVIAVAVMRHFSILVNLYSEKWIQQKEIELVRLSDMHKQAELQALRAKINPHFLYNSLNSIASLARTDAGKTKKMALALSDFFKYAINREQTKTNILEEELNAVSTYLEIEKVRFGNRLNYEIDCPENLFGKHVPQLIIQPLVENAIKHGISKISATGYIKISVSEKKYLLILRVFDSGPPFPEGPISGYGLKNTADRLTMIYGEKANLNWENLPEKFIELQIPINA